MTQPRFDWTADAQMPVARSRAVLASHTSATGAQVANAMASALGLHYLELLERLGEVTDHQAARILGVGLSSINSTRWRLARWIIASGHVERVPWPSGRHSERCFWRRRTPAELVAYDDDQATRQACLPEETPCAASGSSASSS